MVERLVGYSKLHNGVLTIICFIDTNIFLIKGTLPPTPTTGYSSHCCRADTELKSTSILLWKGVRFPYQQQSWANMVVKNKNSWSGKIAYRSAGGGECSRANWLYVLPQLSADVISESAGRSVIVASCLKYLQIAALLSATTSVAASALSPASAPGHHPRPRHPPLTRDRCPNSPSLLKTSSLRVFVFLLAKV